MQRNAIILNVQDVNNIDDNIYEFVKSAHYAANGYFISRLLGFTPLGASITSAAAASFWQRATGQSFTRTIGAWSTLALLEGLQLFMPSLTPDKTFLTFYVLLIAGYSMSASFRYHINNLDNALQRPNIQNNRPG
jgi:hypothetical protein